MTDTKQAKIDPYDWLQNSVEISATNFDFSTNTLESIVTDTSTEDIRIGYYDIKKEIYGIAKASDNQFNILTNPADYTSSDGTINHEKLEAGDVVTFKVFVNLSHQYVQDFKITDFVPLPVII